MKNIAIELSDLAKEYAQKMSKISETEFSAKPDSNKWSKKEILGHLIDSAQNNLRRFIVTQYESTPPEIVYNQDFWVTANRYQLAKKKDLIILWKLMNERIYEVLKNMPPSLYEKECNTGKDQIELHTLKWLAADYFKHTKYHLNQILPGSFPKIIY